MPITKKTGRQKKVVATTDFTFADVASGVYAPAVDLPLGAIVTGGALCITELFNSATTDTFSIGSQGSGAAVATTYAAASADVTATGRAAAVVPTGVKTTESSTVGVVWTGVGAAPTAGKGTLIVEYIISGSEESTFDA